MKTNTQLRMKPCDPFLHTAREAELAHSLTEFMNEKTTHILTLDILTLHLSLSQYDVLKKNCVCVSELMGGHGLMSPCLLFQSAILETRKYQALWEACNYRYQIQMLPLI